MKMIPFALLAWAVVLSGGARGEPLSADKVPAKVKDSFSKKFAGVTEVEWKLKSNKNYEAEFKLKQVELAAQFDAAGKWIETETAIEQSALPKEVQATITKEFKDYKIVETQTVERADDKRELFEVHLENSKEILKLQLDANGKVSSKSAKLKKSP